MKDLKFSLSSILLASLVAPIIFTYSIFPLQTIYLQFTLIFIALIINFLLDITKIPENKYYFYKELILFVTLLLTIGGVFYSVIISRHLTAPVFEIHDIVLQLEEAIRFFLNGVNPYETTYFGTHLEAWHYSENEVNPALYHFVMQPFYLLFSLPFYALSIKMFGFFDGRMPLFFMFVVSLIVCFKITADREKRLLFVILMALNPATFAYLREGRSDFFMYGFFLISMYFLTKGKKILSSILLAIAFAVKQSIWPILPLYFAYIYLKSKNTQIVLKNLVFFLFTFCLIIVPFLVWNPKAFLDSTIFYLSGNTEHSYPISGYGIGVLLHQIGVIQNLQDKFPFTLLQIIFVSPLLVILYKILKKYTSVKILIFSYGILIFAYWYLSRYFNNSHVAFITTVFITAYFWPDDKNSKT